MIDKKRELKSIIGFSIGPILSSAIGFLTTPIVTFFIAPEEYAKLNIYLLFQNILSVSIYLALDQSFVRFYNDREDKKKLWRQAIFIPLIISIILAVIVLFNYRFFSDYLFEIKDNYIPIILFCISIPLIVLERFILLWIRMQENAIKYSTFNILLKVSVLVVTVLLMLLYEKTYISAIYGYVIGQIIVDILLVVSNTELLRWHKHTYNSVDVSELVKYAIPLAPVAFISLMLNSTDRIMLNEIGTLTDVGLYSVALRITGLLGILKTCITSFWTPMSLRWKANGVNNEQFNSVMDIVTVCRSLVFGGCLLIKPIIFLLFGEAYRQAMYIFPYLLFYPILYTICEIFLVGILFKKKGYFVTICSVVSLILNIGINFVLIPMLGAIGAACATALCNGIYFFMVMFFSRKCWYKFPIRKMAIVILLMYISAGINTFVHSQVLVTVVNMITLFLTIALYNCTVKKLFMYVRDMKS